MLGILFHDAHVLSKAVANPPPQKKGCQGFSIRDGVMTVGTQKRENGAQVGKRNDSGWLAFLSRGVGSMSA